jgi:hypothetical protein
MKLWVKLKRAVLNLGWHFYLRIFQQNHEPIIFMSLSKEAIMSAVVAIDAAATVTSG